MTNKLVVIINSLKVPNIKKILLHEMKFLVPNYSCLQNHWLGGYRPQIPVLSVLNWIWWTPPPKINPGNATACSLCNAFTLPATHCRRRGCPSNFKCDVTKFYPNAPNIITTDYFYNVLLWSKSTVNAAAECDPTERQGSSIREAARRT